MFIGYYNIPCSLNSFIISLVVEERLARLGWHGRLVGLVNYMFVGFVDWEDQRGHFP